MSRQSTSLSEDSIVIYGYQKKLKTMKKKFFVLYKETVSSIARLEYYDNEKKFKAGLPPKRVIKLKHCFNINRRLHSKFEYVIALYLKDGGFGIVLENENEMFKWLNSLKGCNLNSSEYTIPSFEHVWQVQVQKKGLAEQKGIVGSYHVGLSSKSITFIRIGSEKSTSGVARISNIEFLLTTIRRCGDSQCYFYMEVGRQSIIGPGELWMETEDSLIAQNMHEMILSAMSSKTDCSMEPMRKRSSSANEASKPINVLYKKQTHSEIKSTNSPQTIMCFGRERCDSLPSRNRTSSECSNQSFIVPSVLNIRSTTISGLRPHSYQRHSSSPPMSTTIGCSESEESSISIDELDDNGSFLSYRFNSRASDGVIPEENTDELTNSDNKYNDHPDKAIDNIEKNYVSMAPLKNTMDISSTNTSRCVPSICRRSPRCDLEFPEYTSDNVTNFPNDVESQSEPPTRAYSIGSRVEHNKINKRIGNVNEVDQNTTRVRAFSVGSRAKISRCDFQWGIMFLKSPNEPNFNSNNNLSSTTDTATFNQNLNLNTCRENKSNSAPLLIHKSHNSVDRMSDLMEIDFSKSSSHTKYQVHSSSKTQVSKSVPNTTRDQIKIHNTKPYNYEDNIINSSKAVSNSIAKTDNGYLEMKPVGNSLFKNSLIHTLNKVDNLCSRSHEYLADSQNISQHPCGKQNKNQSLKNKSSAVLTKTDDNINKKNLKCNQTGTGTGTGSVTSIGSISLPQRNILEDIETQPCLMSSENQKYINTSQSYNNTISEDKQLLIDKLDNFKAFNLSSKYTQLSLTSSPKHGSENVDKDYINIEDKINEHVSANFTENVIKDKSTQKKQLHNESGYEILQIKSDSSLHLTKLINRPNTIRNDEKHFQLVPIRPSSLHSTSTASSTQPSTISCLTSSGAQTTSTTKELNLSNKLNITPNFTPQINSTSRPPSLSSEHELHYASLDLPRSSAEVNAKLIKKDNLIESSPFVASIVNNAYAKIDFDHSDSSSSSSKNFNN